MTIFRPSGEFRFPRSPTAPCPLSRVGFYDAQVVVHAHFHLAVGVGDAVFFGLEFGVGVLLYGVVAFVADADLLVVFDVFIPVALGVQEDLFRPFLSSMRMNTVRVLFAGSGLKWVSLERLNMVAPCMVVVRGNK
jgi:hypothetical protein